MIDLKTVTKPNDGHLSLTNYKEKMKRYKKIYTCTKIINQLDKLNDTKISC